MEEIDLGTLSKNLVAICQELKNLLKIKKTVILFSEYHSA